MSFLSDGIQKIGANLFQGANLTAKANDYQNNDQSIFTTNPITAQKSDNESNDNDDNDKVSFKEGVKAVFGGVKDMFSDTAKQVVDFAKNKPMLAGGVGLGVAAMGVAMAVFPPIAIAGGIAMAGVGAYNLLKEDGSLDQTRDAIKEYKNAENKEDALKALHDAGYNGTDAAGDVLSVVAGASVATNATKALTAGIKATSACDYYDSMKFLNGSEATITRQAESDAVVRMLLRAETEKALEINVAAGAPISTAAACDDVLPYLDF